MVSLSKKQQEQDGKGVTVMFGRPTKLRASIPDNTVLIVPNTDKWNDFQLRTRIDIRIRLIGDKNEYITYGFIGFLNSSSETSNGVVNHTWNSPS